MTMSKDVSIYKNKKEQIIIGPNRPVHVIAEAGVLTFGEKKTGFRFVDEAAKAGIKLLKFQCFVPENVVSKADKFWLERLKQRALSKKDFLEIMKYGRKKGVVCFASTHNEYDLVDLAKKGMPILKLGSGDSNNFRMIDMALATGKPVILSLGLLTLPEIFSVLKRYKKYSGRLIIMHCTTIYPTPPSLANLNIIKEMSRKFPQFNFGYSDHVRGYNVALAASSFPEVTVIEKHICLPEHRVNPKFESLDIVAGLIPKEFRVMLSAIDEIYKATSKVKISNAILENKKWAHKAICARKNIAKGKILKPEDLMSIRPYRKKDGHIAISEFYNIIGKKAAKNIRKGEYVSEADIHR